MFEGVVRLLSKTAKRRMILLQTGAKGARIEAIHTLRLDVANDKIRKREKKGLEGRESSWNGCG